VLGRSFFHPVMRIGFTAPAGFTLTNSPQAILLTGPGGLRGQFGGGPMPDGRIDLYAQQLAQQIIGEGQAQVSASQAVVNGVRAMLVEVQLATREGVLPISIAAYDGGKGQAYHFAVLSPPAQPSTELVTQLFRSFRRLSAEEASRLRPRVIRTVAVGPQDSIETLAARMAGTHQRELFMLLNGKAAQDRLRPGERVKIVTWAGQ
jgi:predicted Zn-dependent protease